MKWFRRTICNDVHHEFRNEEHEKYDVWFNIIVQPSGRITLYDIRECPANHYIGFTDLRHAKRIAAEGVDNKKAFEPYIDHKSIEDSKRFVKVMADAERLLKSLDEDGKKES